MAVAVGTGRAVPTTGLPASPQPSLGPCWRPIARLLDPAVRSPDWSAKLRGALRSAVTGRQWPQERKFRAGLVDSAACKLCAAPVGTLLHRSVSCPAHDGIRCQHAPEG